MFKKLIALILIISFVGVFASMPVYSLEWMAIRPNMSDSDFFGVWDGNDWTTAPKLNYEHSDGLVRVGEAAKNAGGDYSAAKENYLYWAKYEKGWTEFTLERSVATSNLRAESFMWQNSTYVATFSVKQTEEQYIQIDVTGKISRGLNCLKFVALQRNIGDILISGVDGDPDKVPNLQMMVDGAVRRFPAVKDSYISAGAMTETFSAPLLPLRESGSPWDASSKRAFIYFDVTGLSATSTIEGAVLNLYVSAQSDESDKEVVIFKDSNIMGDTWVERESAMYNFNGLHAEDFNWDRPPLASELTYTEESGRLAFLPGMAAEYLYTGNEYYAYNSIRLILDFFYKNGLRSGTLLTGYTGSNMPGSWSSSLQCGIRLGNIAMTMPVFIKSVYMNPDRFTEIMKNVYIMMDFIAQIDTPLNWGTTELRNFSYAAETFDELAKISDWYDYLTPRLLARVSENILADGTFIEASESYAHIGFKDYLSLLPDTSDIYSFGEEYADVLKKFAEWLVNVMSPSGIGPGWGDSEADRMYKGDGPILDIQRLTGDPHILFWLTNGKQGQPYPYTSKFFPERKMATLRTGWQNDDLYMMITNRGGNHSHSDKLSVVAAAYGKILLADPGRYVYDDISGVHDYLTSTKAHNTVLINNKNQGVETKPSETNAFIAGKALDFFQGTFYPSGFAHSRSIFFAKPGYWIVSDDLTPDDNAASNTYAQLWHSYSWMHKDDETGGGRTNFDDGKNMQVVPVGHEKIKTETKLGYYGGSGGVEDRNYLSLEKQAAGRVTFDTVLYPNNYNDATKVRTERVPLADPENGTAMRIILDEGTWSTDDYYYMSYLPLETLKFADFGHYRYDGKAVHIMQDIYGNPVAASIAGGAKLYWDTIPLVEYMGDYFIEDMKVEWNAVGIEIEVATGKIGTIGEMCPVKIYAPHKLYWVKVNGQFLNGNEYRAEDGYLYLELDLK